VLGRVVQVAQAAGLGPVHVLGDDDRILDEARRHGAAAIRSDGPWRNGTERIAAALSQGRLPWAPIVLNVQGDAVGLEAPALPLAVLTLRRDRRAPVATVGVAAPRGEHGGRTTVVGAGGRALWFSRLPLPADRDGIGGNLLLHVGLYAYRASALVELASLPPGPAELSEGLEQLRWLEHGVPVALATPDAPWSWAHAVDVGGDLRPGVAR
jgi:3-deoxy-manno-octulosonate cytidylyltransferase (CMP-KDO synthetase)